MAFASSRIFTIVAVLVAAYGARADDEVKCSRLAHVPCGDRACFHVNFDNARKLASVSVPPGVSRQKGDLEAAVCYSEHWRQIPMLEKLVEREREGRAMVPASFTFAIVRRCEFSTDFEPDDVPAPWAPNYSSKPTC